MLRPNGKQFDTETLNKIARGYGGIKHMREQIAFAAIGAIGMRRFKSMDCDWVAHNCLHASACNTIQRLTSFKIDIEINRRIDEALQDCNIGN